MYESPIDKIYGEIHHNIIKQDEDNIMCAVNQAVGYSVDKQELIKALNYDREQYSKGYKDALLEMKKEIEDYNGWGDISSTDYKAIMNIICKRL